MPNDDEILEEWGKGVRDVEMMGLSSIHISNVVSPTILYDYNIFMLFKTDGIF